MESRQRYSHLPLKGTAIAPTITPSAEGKNSDHVITIVVPSVSGQTNGTNTQPQSTDTTSETSQSQISGQLTLGLSPTSTCSLSDGLAKITQLLDNEPDKSKVAEAAYLLRQCEYSGLKSPSISLLRMSPDFSASMRVMTSTKQLDCLPTLGMTCNGNVLIQGGFSPKIESGFTLSDILEPSPDPRYFLSEKQVAHIEKIMRQQSPVASMPTTEKDS